jgi:nucleoid DNA-binding protein
MKFYLKLLAHNACPKLTNTIKSGHLMGTLTKRDLVVQISQDTGEVQQTVFKVVQLTLDHITEALARGENVELRNFGVLEVRRTKPRVGRNPNKPESSFVIPARATVKFKPGKVMRERVLKLSDGMKKKESGGKKVAAKAVAKPAKAAAKAPAKAAKAAGKAVGKAKK